MIFGKFLSVHLCRAKLNNILTLSVTSFMCTSLGSASAHCINLQLQRPKSHIKLKDLFWGTERFTAEKVKIRRIGIWRTLLWASTLLALQVCSPNSRLCRETRKPGETVTWMELSRFYLFLAFVASYFNLSSPWKLLLRCWDPHARKIKQ